MKKLFNECCQNGLDYYFLDRFSDALKEHFVEFDLQLTSSYELHDVRVIVGEEVIDLKFPELVFALKG